MEINSNINSINRTNQNEIIKSPQSYKGANYLMNNMGNIIGFEHNGKRALFANTSVAEHGKLKEVKHNYTRQEVNQMIDDYTYRLKLQEKTLQKMNKRSVIKKHPPNIGVVKQLDLTTTGYYPKTQSVLLIRNILADAANVDNQIHGILKGFKSLKSYKNTELRDQAIANRNILLEKSKDLQDLREKAKKAIKENEHMPSSHIDAMKEKLTSIKDGLHKLGEFQISQDILSKNSQDIFLSDIKNTMDKANKLVHSFKPFSDIIKSINNSNNIKEKIEAELLKEYKTQASDLLSNIKHIDYTVNNLGNLAKTTAEPDSADTTLTKMKFEFNIVKKKLQTLKNVRNMKTSVSDINSHVNNLKYQFANLLKRFEELSSQSQSPENKMLLQKYKDNTEKELENLSTINLKDVSSTTDTTNLIEDIKESHIIIDSAERSLQELKDNIHLLDPEDVYSSISGLYKENEHKVYPYKEQNDVELVKQPYAHTTDYPKSYSVSLMRNILVDAANVNNNIHNLLNIFNTYKAEDFEDEDTRNQLITHKNIILEKSKDLQDLREKAKKSIKENEHISSFHIEEMEKKLKSIKDTLQDMEKLKYSGGIIQKITTKALQDIKVKQSRKFDELPAFADSLKNELTSLLKRSNELLSQTPPVENKELLQSYNDDIEKELENLSNINLQDDKNIVDMREWLTHIKTLNFRLENVEQAIQELKNNIDLLDTKAT